MKPAQTDPDQTVIETEPMISIAKLVAEYGIDEVLEAISMVEIYVH